VILLLPTNWPTFFTCYAVRTFLIYSQLEGFVITKLQMVTKDHTMHERFLSEEQFGGSKWVITVPVLLKAGIPLCVKMAILVGDIALYQQTGGVTSMSAT